MLPLLVLQVRLKSCPERPDSCYNTPFLSTGGRGSHADSRMCHPSNGRRSQRRAGAFRDHTQTRKLITIVNATGARRIIEKTDRLQLLSHKDTLNALEHRAIRYITTQQSQNQQDRALVNAARTNPELTSPALQQSLTAQQDEADISWYVANNNSLLSPIGICPGKRQKAQLAYCMKILMGCPLG
jgi:hypothetical protein